MRSPGERHGRNLVAFDPQGTNFAIVVPTRKRRRDGEVFAIHYPSLHGFIIGRVIRAKAFPQGPVGILAGSRLVYVFKGVLPSKEMPPREHLLATNLLIPPMFLDKSPWSLAGVEVIGSIEIEHSEVLETHCFRDTVYSKPGNEIYYDGNGINDNGELNALENPIDPVGTMTLQNMWSIDLHVSRALDLPDPTAFM